MFEYIVDNASTLENVVHADGFATMDEATRAAQEFLLVEADQADDDDAATDLDHAAQELNYGDRAMVGGTYEWSVVVGLAPLGG